ncbi:MAG: hypothetical protein LCH52_11635 [Bacteroidetes bacterium]|nr:hypothetical protein [Bacteroidota bacterium]
MEVIISERSFFPRALAISLAIHLLVVAAAVVVSRFSSAPKYGSLNTLNMVFDDTEQSDTPPELPMDKPETKPVPKDDNAVVRKQDQSQPPPPAAPKGLIAGAFDSVDSSLVTLEYKESTLNVKIKYSAGWAFLDNNERSKLDAVTFWNPNVPNSPWVQLKVTDKYLFRESRYKTKEELDSYTAFYNKEEVTEGEVKFEIYLRTKSSEDYILTFRVKGEDTFRKYRPVFMAMLKSFKFGLF